MKRQRKRIVFARLLLAVFLLTLTGSALHIHQPAAGAAFDCVDCAHHVQHDGHLTADSHSLHDCVLCQFLSLVYTAATAIAITVFVSRVSSSNYDPVVSCRCRCVNHKSPRAPPYYII